MIFVSKLERINLRRIKLLLGKSDHQSHIRSEYIYADTHTRSVLTPLNGRFCVLQDCAQNRRSLSVCVYCPLQEFWSMVCRKAFRGVILIISYVLLRLYFRPNVITVIFYFMNYELNLFLNLFVVFCLCHSEDRDRFEPIFVGWRLECRESYKRLFL